MCTIRRSAHRVARTLGGIAFILLLSGAPWPWGWAGSAAAGGPIPVARGVAFDPNDPDRIAVYVARMGLFLSTDGGATYRLACSRLLLIGSDDLPVMRYTPSGQLLVAVPKGVWRSGSEGCDWSEPHPDVRAPTPDDPDNDAPFVQDLIVDPEDPTSYYVATSAHYRPGIFHSSDEGGHWAQIESFPQGEVAVYSVRIWPRDPQQRVLGVAERDASSLDLVPAVYVSTDGGQTWDARRVDLQEHETFRFVYLSPHDAQRLIGVARPRRHNDERPQRVLLSEDGGLQWREVLQVREFGGLTTDEDASRLWIGDAEGGLYRSNDDGASFEQIDDALRVGCLEHAHGRLWACGQNDADCFSLGYSLDEGQTFTPAMIFKDYAGLVQCEASPQNIAAVCDGRVEYLDDHIRSAEGGACDMRRRAAAEPDAGIVAGGEEKARKGGCSVAAGSAGGAAAHWLLWSACLGSMLRRRRR